MANCKKLWNKGHKWVKYYKRKNKESVSLTEKKHQRNRKTYI